MKAISTWVGLAAASAALAASAAALVGSGKLETQTRNLESFNGVAIAIPAEVEVLQGAPQRVVISADDNVLPLIESAVEGGVLQLRLREGTQLRNAKIRVSVRARELESIAIAGSAEVRAAALATPKLALRISGSGDAHLGGKAGELDVRISGSGDVQAGQLDTQRASVSISGSGDATVWARESLRVHVAGAGDVRYFGDPRVEKSVAGSGSVRRVGAAPS